MSVPQDDQQQEQEALRGPERGEKLEEMHGVQYSPSSERVPYASAEWTGRSVTQPETDGPRRPPSQPDWELLYSESHQRQLNPKQFRC
jgi:hypothetical protein